VRMMSTPRAERRIAPSRPRELLAFAVMLGLFETVLFMALAPLVPVLLRELHLSTTDVGLMGAAYPAGAVLAAVPVGYVMGAIGPRTMSVTGLWGLAIGSLAFAIGNSAITLDLARVLQGAGSAAAWGGALAWIAAAYPVAERGRAMGITFSAAFVGILLGPVIGAVAASAGREVTFMIVAGGLSLVALWGGPRHMAVARPTRERTSLAAFRHPALLLSLGCVSAQGVVSGLTSALGPVLLASRDLGAGAIAACFLAAAAPQIVLTPLLGRRLGRSGLVQFCIVGTLLAAPLIPLATVPSGPLGTAAIFSLVVAVEYIVFNPLMLLASSVAERLGRSQGFTMSLANGCWGLGAAVGSLGLAKLADSTSLSDAFAAAGLITLVTAVVLAAGFRARILAVGESSTIT
jgi:MFS family permease